MSSSHDSVESTIKRAKASATYRSLETSEARAAWLHQEHGIPQRRAASEEGLSRSLLQRYLLAKAENRERSSSLNSMTLGEIRSEASILSRENSTLSTRTSPPPKKPSRSYVYGFVERNPELQIRKARVLESDRAKFVTPTTIGSFFDKLEALAEEAKYSPGMIANFDETMIQCTAKKLTVIGHAESKSLFITQQNEMPHITLGVCVFADGTHAPHLVIYPLKKLPPEVNEEFLQTYPNTVFCGQPSGWINCEILENHLSKSVIAHFDAQRQKPGASRRGLLLIDGHASRINPKLWQTFKDNDIDVLTFVSHASHILQPLDLCVFGVFKAQLRGGMTSLKALSLGQKRAAVMKRAFDSLYHALSPTNIQAGFEKAGVYPLDRDVPLGHPAINRDLDTSPVPIRKRRTVIRLDGDTLTSQEAIQRMMEQSSPLARTRGRPKLTGRKQSKKRENSNPYDSPTSEYSGESSEEE